MWIPHKIFRLYWRIRRPRTRGVKALAIDAEGNVLLVRHSYGNSSAWILPGGGVGKRETPETAIVRELQEELNLVPENVSLFGVYVSSSEGKSDTVSVFLARCAEKPRISSREILEAQFFAPRTPPPATSPATRRRLEELLKGAPLSDSW